MWNLTNFTVLPDDLKSGQEIINYKFDSWLNILQKNPGFNPNSKF